VILKRLLRLTMVLVTFCAIAIVATLSLLASESGSRWLLQRIIDHNNIPLTIETIEGRLLDNLLLYNLRYRADSGHSITAERVDLNWSPAELLQRRVHIHSLGIHRLTVTAAGDDSEIADIPLIEMPALPLRIRVDRLQLLETELLVNDRPLRIDRAEAGFSLDESVAEVKHIHVQSGDHKLTGAAGLTGAARPRMNMELHWEGAIDNAPASGQLRIGGRQDDLVIQLQLAAQIDLIINGRINLAASTPVFDLHGQVNGSLPTGLHDYVQSTGPVKFTITGSPGFAEARVSTALLTADGESLDIDLQADAALPKSGAGSDLNVTFEWQSVAMARESPYNLAGRGDITWLSGVMEIEHDLTQPSNARLEGRIDFNDDPVVDLRMDWEPFEFTVMEGRTLKIAEGRMNAGGTLAALALDARTRFALRSTAGDAHAAMDMEADFIHLDIDGEMNLAGEQPEGQFAGTLTGPVPAPLQNHVHKPGPIQFELTLKPQTALVDLATSAYSGSGTAVALTVKGKVDLPGNTTPATMAMFDWNLAPTGATDAVNTYTGQAKIRYENDRVSITHKLLQPFASQLDGLVDMAPDRETRLDLALNWTGLSIPLDDRQPLQSPHGNIHISGPLSALNASITSRFESTPIGPLSVQAETQWTEPELTIHELKIDIFDGRIKATGVVTLADILRARLDLRGHDLDLKGLQADLKTRLDLIAGLDLDYQQEQLNGVIDIASLAGEWRGHRLTGKALITRRADRLRVETLRLTSGENRIDMELNLQNSISGYLDLDIKDMSEFSANLAGNLKGRFDIDGMVEQPRISGQLDGADILVQELRIATLKADSAIDLRPGQQSSITLQTGTLQYQDLILDEVTISGSGLTRAHTVNVTANGNDMTLSAQLDGSWMDRTWQGIMQRLQVDTPDTGAWSLASPATLEWQQDSGQLQLDNTCLTQDSANVCVAGRADPDQALDVSARVQQLPLGLMHPWLPETVSLQGAVSGDVKARRRHTDWDLKAELQGSGARVSAGTGDDMETLEVPMLSLSANVTHEQRTWKLQLGSPGYFDLDFAGRINLAGEQTLDARLDLNLEQIDWLARIEPTLSGSKGAFQISALAGGTARKPRIKGDFRLLNGRLTVPPIGLVLDRIHGEFHSGETPEQVLLDATLGSADRQLALNGEINLLAEQDYPYRLTLRGDGFPAVRTADMSVDVSPDLEFHGSLALHHVRGSLDIPRLELLVTSLPEDSVSVSPDTTIVQSKQAGARPVPEGNSGSDFIRNRVDVDITADLGPDIHIQGFGLNTGLAGDIRVIKPAGVYQPRGEGFVNLTDGSYRAYGQNLVIEKGQLQFAGALDNPALSVRAYRPNLSVRPGVRVDGYARQPRLTLYSEPAQSDADTLSWLITGRPISGASSEEAGLLAQAALSLGAEQSSILTNEIENLFRLDEFTVGAGSTVNDTSVSAAKRISPNLTFRSSFNPFNQLWSFLVNYRLTDHWSVQSESGVSQGADIIYSIETNTFTELFDKLWQFTE